jgi:hypothetical protein
MLLPVRVIPKKRHSGGERAFFKGAAYPQIQQHQGAGLLMNFLLMNFLLMNFLLMNFLLMTRLRLIDDDAPAAMRQFLYGFP